MILELDCGNSLIKWRIVDSHTLQVLARGATQHAEQVLIDINNCKLPIAFCRIVSVRSEKDTLFLIAAIKDYYSIIVDQAVSSAEACGVKNGYLDANRLGVDRWLAIVAAYQQSKQATLVLSFGTAITSDFIDNQGQHLGGFIAPGLLLMRQQLLENTSRIHYHEKMASDLLSPVLVPGKSTEEAVNGGCYLMLQSFISQQQMLAEKYFGASYSLYITGGDAMHFDIPHAQYQPDLVFAGLALLCPETGR